MLVEDDARWLWFSALYGENAGRLLPSRSHKRYRHSTSKLNRGLNSISTPETPSICTLAITRPHFCIVSSQNTSRTIEGVSLEGLNIGKPSNMAPSTRAALIPGGGKLGLLRCSAFPVLQMLSYFKRDEDVS